MVVVIDKVLFDRMALVVKKVYDSPILDNEYQPEPMGIHGINNVMVGIRDVENSAMQTHSET